MPSKEIVCSLFAGIRPAVRDTWRGTWQAFVGDLLPDLLVKRVPCPTDPTPEERQHAKKRCPGFVLAPFASPRREDANCGAHTALAIDVDRLPNDDLGALLKRASRFRCAVYETPSSTDEAPRVRVVAALRRALEPEYVIGARRAFAEALGLDPAEAGTTEAEAASQVMFAGRLKGSRPRGLWTFDGEAWRAPRLRAAPTSTRRPPTPRSTERRAPPKLRAGAYDFSSPPDLSSLAKHVPPPGQDGDRHLLVRGLGGWLGRRGYSPEAIAEAVREQIPSSDPAERAAQAADAAERAREGLDAPGWEALSEWAERHAKGASTLRRLERACRDPREPQGFDGIWSEWWAGVLPRFEARATERAAARPITDGSETVAAGSEIDGTGLHLHPATGWPWILQRDNAFWLHRVSEQTYHPEVRASELEASVARDLAGLIGEEDRTPTALRSAWIKPLRELRATYVTRQHTYDPETRTLTLAALRWAPLAPRKHAHIDRWLHVLFGAGYDAAAQWLAAVTTLDRPAPCLYLPGPRGLGKSLLADGLARLWCRPAAVDMSEAIDNFNEATGACPLVFTDEGFPEGMRFERFRKMVTEHSRRVNAKNRSKVDVEGCGRFMIAANNEDVLRYQKIGTLTRDDLEAIADRLLVVPCHAAARAELDAWGPGGTDRAAAGGEIAEHVLWLASTVELEPTGRMAAKPGGGERILAGVVAGRSAEVLARIRESIGTGQLGERSGVRVSKRDPEAVYVNVRRLMATFDGRVALAAVSECCDSFALRPGTEQHKSSDNENLRWRVLSRLRLDEAFAKLD